MHKLANANLKIIYSVCTNKRVQVGKIRLTAKIFSMCRKHAKTDCKESENRYDVVSG